MKKILFLFILMSTFGCSNKFFGGKGGNGGSGTIDGKVGTNGKNGKNRGINVSIKK